MKAKTINVQITRCPRQYESIRLGGEWSVDEGENEKQVMSKALELLNGYYEELMHPKTEQPAEEQVEQPKEEQPQEKTKLVFGKDDKLVQKIVDRITAGVTLETALSFYEPDEQVMNIFKVAAALKKE